MATPAQINANRANAQHSSGPVSVEGKAATRFNAMKHGIDAESLVIPGEDPEELKQLADRFFADLQPEGAVETAYAQAVVRAEWFRRRYTAIEAGVWKSILKSMDDPNATLGDAFHHDATGRNVLGKLHRRQQAAVREYNQAMAALDRIQKARLAYTLACLEALPPLPPEAVPQARPERPAAAPNSRHPAPVPGQPWVGSEPPSWRL